MQKMPKIQNCGTKKYGKLPPPQNWIDVSPWETVHIESVGPLSVKLRLINEGKVIKTLVFALTMIDRATNWPEFAIAKDATTITASNLFDKVWLCRYPRPKNVVHDNGTEFSSEFLELLASYGIKSKPTTVKNPQSNAMIERVHLTMGDMLRTKTFEGEDWMEELDNILQSMAWAIRVAVNSSTGHTPGQMAFNKNNFF